MTIPNNNGFTISTDQSKLNIDLVHGFLVNSYWARGVPRELVEKSIRNSATFGLFNKDQQVGFARVVSDFTTFAYLADVFVIDEVRGQGLGKWLVQEIFNDPRFSAVRRWHLITDDAHDLYGKFGFNRLAHPEQHMELRRLNPYQ